ncbi:hypothetical protein HA466_0014360 [Hirschfeldia incana]|nr:hypothetical protein HA466_0014360 [Hirschfeldia incana]
MVEFIDASNSDQAKLQLREKAWFANPLNSRSHTLWEMLTVGCLKRRSNNFKALTLVMDCLQFS